LLQDFLDASDRGCKVEGRRLNVHWLSR